MSDLKELESKRQGVFGMMAGSTHPRTGKLITAEKETLRLIELVNDYGDVIKRLEAAEKRVAELDRRNHVLREQRDGETIKRSDIEAQLAALAKSHAQVIESRDLHKKVAATRAAPPSLPEGWVSCSPEWIERNGPCSCSEAPRIAFGNIGPHYHPAVYSAAPPAPIKMPAAKHFGVIGTAEVCRAYPAEAVIAAIRAAGIKLQIEGQD